MGINVEQLRELAQLYDQWQSALALPPDASAAEFSRLQSAAALRGEEFANAFATMIKDAAAGGGATTLPPLTDSARLAAVAASMSDAGAITEQSLNLDTPPPPRESGQHVGPYRLIKELGRGGMGVVWLAARADGQHERQVALKMPLVENLNWLLAARFARERNILASLEHPGIARLYDAGVDSETQPYIALEYVVGVPINDYVRDQQLKPEATVALFTKVINAVSHAHAQLVIHRDIKPSNILVDAKGEPHLLDFGIAKLLDDEDSMSADATQLTRMSGRALTLDYASPEQVNGQTLGTASDVYALGVVLYELLTGNKPYAPKGPTRRDLELAIVEQEPAKPSDRLMLTGTSESGKTARRIRGDLDTVVLKALKKDPRQRYATAQAFADDLKRYLAFEPITAKPDSEWYRITKFVRRNRLVLAAVAAVGLALGAGAAATLWQSRLAVIQRDIAVEERERSVAVRSFFGNLIAEASGDGKPFTTSEWLATAAKIAQDRFSEDPMLRATLLSEIGTIYLDIGDTEKALDLSKRAVAAAANVKDSGFRAEHACLFALVTSNRDPVRAIKMADEALNLLSDGYREQASRATCLMIRGVAENYAGQSAPSLASFEAAATVLQRQPYHDKRRDIEVLALLANGYHFSNRHEESNAAFQRLEQRRIEYETNNSTAAVIDYRNWALALHSAGDALGSLEKNALSERVAERLGTGGTLMFVQGECRALLAQGHYAEVRDRMGEMFAKGGAELQSAQHVRSGRSMQLQAELKLGNLDMAARRLTEFADSMNSLAPDSAIRHSVILYKAQLLRLGGKPIEAKALLEPAALLLKSRENSQNAVQDTDAELARIQSALGFHREAQSLILGAVEAQRAMYGKSAHSFWLGHLLSTQGDISLAAGDSSTARNYYQEARTHYITTLGKSAPRVAETESKLAMLSQ